MTFPPRKTRWKNGCLALLITLFETVSTYALLTLPGFSYLASRTLRLDAAFSVGLLTLWSIGLIELFRFLDTPITTPEHRTTVQPINFLAACQDSYVQGKITLEQLENRLDEFFQFLPIFEKWEKE